MPQHMDYEKEKILVKKMKTDLSKKSISRGCKFFCVYGGKILPVKFRYVQLAVELWY